MRLLHEKRATSREILGWTIILVLAIIVLIILILWLSGDFTTVSKAVIRSIMSRFIGIGV